MRGTLERVCAGLCRARIIPAYAGNTCAIECSAHAYGDHPRVCGEHMPSVSARAMYMGSSPRMRGTPHVRASDGSVRGIIPAYAGNTRTCLQAPPRGGIIPAYAGNTRCAARWPSPAGDHPRVCGEHSATVKFTPWLVGSSPRMRGTPLLSIGTCVGTGIIPAYAGNTWSDTSPAQMPRDHPRVCGEHTKRL